MITAPSAAGDNSGGRAHGSVKMSAGADKAGAVNKRLEREEKVRYLLQLLKKRGDQAAGEMRARVLAKNNIIAKGNTFGVDVMAEALQIYNEQRALSSTRESGGGSAPISSGGRLKRKYPTPAPELEDHSCRSSGPPDKVARHHAINSEPAHKVESTPHLAELHTPCRSSRTSPQTGSKQIQVPASTPAVSSKAQVFPTERRPTASKHFPEQHFHGTRVEASVGKVGEPFHGGGAPSHAASPEDVPSPSRQASKALPPQSTSQRETPEPHPEPCPSASPAAPGDGSVPCAAASGSTSSSDFSVKELKGLLSEHRIDFSRCVEKADLQALWNRFDILRQRPLQELRDSCAARGARPVPRTAEECAARLLAEDTAPAAAAAVPEEPAGPERSASATFLGAADSGPSPDIANRELEAKREVNRIASLRKGSFHSTAAWGFVVLGVTTKDLASVQRGYRNLMKKLHPDKVQHTDAVAKAVEACREAKEACERGLSRQEVPGQPRALNYKVECLTPGQRQFRLGWHPPIARECAPVRRYIVAAFDPAYGKALTVAVLEPDYDEELRRFVSVEEIDHYILSERELVKMPLLWKKETATVQVAAANEAGQSSWTSLQVALNGRPPAPAAGFGLNSLMSQLGSGYLDSSPSGTSSSRDAFEQELQARRLAGDGLDTVRPFLERQRKPLLQGWLQASECPAEGTKEILVERVLWVLSKRWRD